MPVSDEEPSRLPASRCASATLYLPMPMDCREFLSRYSDYDDSLLSSAELERFHDHMSRCASCARYDRVLRKGRMLVRQAPRLNPGEEFVPRLHPRLWQEHVERPRHSGRVSAGMATALAGFTVVVVSVWAVVLIDSASSADIAADGAAEPGSAVAAELGSAALELAPQYVRAPGRLQPDRHQAGWRVLPPAHEAPPRDWSARRVDQPVAASYSPLVTGPPSYRASAAAPASAAISTEYTFD